MELCAQEYAWIHPGKARYYRVYLDRDLFGDWTLRQVWGGIHSNRGRMRTTGVVSYADGLARIRDITKVRTRHGYTAVLD